MSTDSGSVTCRRRTQLGAFSSNFAWSWVAMERTLFSFCSPSSTAVEVLCLDSYKRNGHHTWWEPMHGTYACKTQDFVLYCIDYIIKNNNDNKKNKIKKTPLPGSWCLFFSSCSSRCLRPFCHPFERKKSIIINFSFKYKQTPIEDFIFT